MPKKLRIRVAGKPAVVIHRSAIQKDRVVYIAVANRPSKYPHGRSRIVYIGTTKAGASRIAASAAGKAKELLALHGVTHLEFYVISCRPRQRVQTWRKMERGMILCFRQAYGEIPKCNTHGIGMKWRDERKYFTEARSLDYREVLVMRIIGIDCARGCPKIRWAISDLPLVRV